MSTEAARPREYALSVQSVHFISSRSYCHIHVRTVRKAEGKIDDGSMLFQTTFSKFNNYYECLLWSQMHWEAAWNINEIFIRPYIWNINDCEMFRWENWRHTVQHVKHFHSYIINMIVHPQIIILTSFQTRLTFLCSKEHKSRDFEECC